MRIVVLGYIVRGPLGGLVWHHLQYMLSLKQMGYEVLFLEDSGNFPACYNPEHFTTTEDPTYGLCFIDEVFKTFELDEQWAYFDAHANRWYGQPAEKVKRFCASAEIVLNLSGVNPLREWWAFIPCRVFVDTDPGFTQIKHLTLHEENHFADQHTHFFSFAENIGNSDCSIPDDGYAWKPTRQPVFLDAWKPTPPQPTGKWTTVMQWDSYRKREYNQMLYGMKSLSFRKYDLLPQAVLAETFELALGGPSSVSNELRSKGWEVISSLVPTRTPATYQKYISSSKGEWSVAKQGYVISNSGWFSERSLCYMASGRPVVVQDTGFSKTLPVGEGLCSFSSLQEAVEQMKKVSFDYPHHCKKARQIVEGYFAGTTVLKDMLNNLN